MTFDLLAGSLRLLVAVALTVAAAWRLAPRLMACDRPASSELVLRTGLMATLAVIWPVVLFGTVGGLGPTALLVTAVVLFAASSGPLSPVRGGEAARDRGWGEGEGRRQPAPDPPPQPSPRGAGRGRSRRRWRLFWPLAPVVVLLGVEAALFLPAAPVDWDPMTYHLHFPARWLQEGRIVHIPTVFSDDSSAFAPQNGALFFTWQMALLGSDATTNVVQLLGLALMATALYRAVRSLGLGRQPAAMAAALLCGLAPLRRWASSANVDIFMTAFFLAAVAWLLARVLRRERGSSVAAGLAIGLAMGTKTVGLPLALVPAAILGLVLVGGRCWRELGGFAAAALAGGGFWYLRNLVLYGNPLFPLDFELFGVRFAGVYGTDALRGSFLRLTSPGAWAESMAAQLGTSTCVVAALGLAGLGGLALRTRGGGHRRVAALGLGGFVLSWTWYCYAVIPHNNQSRFVIPALVVASVGWAHWFEAARRRRAGAAFFVLALGGVLVASRPDRDWGRVLERLAAAEVAMVGWAAFATLTALVVAYGAWRFRSARGFPRRGTNEAWLALGGTLAWFALAMAATASDQSRMAFLARADYRLWAPAYLMFNDPATPPLRIAYSGMNVPYALAGAGWKHEVRYCNTQGSPDDGLHEFWRRDPRRHATHKPGLYRGFDDRFNTWWACLERHAIDMVAITVVNPVERPEHWRLSDDFPLEREWMRQRPERFERVLGTGTSEIYRVKTRPDSEP